MDETLEIDGIEMTIQELKSEGLEGSKEKDSKEGISPKSQPKK